MSIDISNHSHFESVIGGNHIQMSQLALNWIEEFLTQRKDRTGKPIRIAEFGSGASTIWFGQNFPNDEIISMEGNKEWYKCTKGWLSKFKVKNVKLLYAQQTNFYTTEDEVNERYFTEVAKQAPFDLIINDGGMREEVGQRIMAQIDTLLSSGGVYLRHDYEQALVGAWVGFYQGKIQPLGYDKFCSEHDGYELLTVSGNGKWGFRCEFGGIWRK